MKIVIGTNCKRGELLKSCGIPGYKLCCWMMDSTVSKFWVPKVIKLGKLLGVDHDKVFEVG